MRSGFLICLSILTTVIMNYGCTSSNTKVPDDLETAFQELINIKDMNSFFQISVASSPQDDIEFGSDITIIFNNLTDQTIVFPVGYGIKLFIIRNNEWLDVENNNQYYGERSILQTKNQQRAGARITTGVRPVIPSGLENTGEKVILRILVVGELTSESDGITIPVGAYTDLLIKMP